MKKERIPMLSKNRKTNLQSNFKPFWLLRLVTAIIAPLVLIQPLTGAMAFETSEIAIHGFVSQGFLRSSSNNYMGNSEKGNFDFNEVGINFSTHLRDDLRVGLQVLSRDMGKQGNNDVGLDWAFGDFRWRDWMGFRFGKMKMPLNLHNETRDMDFLRTSILLPAGVYDETLRDMTQAFQGLDIYGNVPVGKIGNFDYDLYTGTINISKDGGLAKYFEDMELFSVENIDVNDFYGLKVKWNTQIEGLSLGFSKQKLDINMKGTLNPRLTLLFNPALATTPALPIPGYPAMPWLPVNMELTGNLKSEFEFIEYVKGSWTFSTEKWRIFAPYDLNPAVPAALRGTNPANRKGSYYSASYRHNRFFEWSYYYSKFEDFVPAANWGGNPDSYYYLKDDCVSLRYDAAENWLLKGEIHKMDGASLLLKVDNPAGRDNDWWLYAFKTTYSY